MGVAVAAWLAAAVFAELARRRTRRAVLVPLAVLLLLAAVAAALLALLVAALTCWDECDEYGDAWRDSPDSWQWNGQLVPAGVGLLTTAATLALTIARRYTRAIASVAVAAAAFTAWGLILAPLA
jgi:hypothetical protein